ncbi:hypothetical protein GCG54_00004579, partial [Colletotrichum gloeosporioides]
TNLDPSLCSSARCDAGVHSYRIVAVSRPARRMAAQQRPLCLLHAGGVLVKRFWIRPVVVRFGDRHPFPLATASFCLTLCVFQEETRCDSGIQT